MAPHGKALEGDDVLDQWSSGVGGTDWWWAAEFEFIDPEKRLHAATGRRCGPPSGAEAPEKVRAETGSR